MDDKFQELIKSIKQSDTAAFKQFFDYISKPLCHFIFLKTHDAVVAEDLVQETFIKIWESRHRLNEGLSLKAYAYKIANNLTLNYLRHVKVESNFRQHLEFEPVSGDSPDVLLENNEFQSQFLKAVDQLPQQTRMVFLMSRTEDLSYKEIAEILDISIKTVESHIGKALRLLRDQLHFMH